MPCLEFPEKWRCELVSGLVTGQESPVRIQLNVFKSYHLSSNLILVQFKIYVIIQHKTSIDICFKILHPSSLLDDSDSILFVAETTQTTDQS